MYWHATVAQGRAGNASWDWDDAEEVGHRGVRGSFNTTNWAKLINVNCPSGCIGNMGGEDRKGGCASRCNGLNVDVDILVVLYKNLVISWSRTIATTCRTWDRRSVEDREPDGRVKAMGRILYDLFLDSSEGRAQNLLRRCEKYNGFQVWKSWKKE